MEAGGELSKEVGTAVIVDVPELPEKRLRTALPGWTGDEKRSCAETAGELGTPKIYEQEKYIFLKTNFFSNVLLMPNIKPRFIPSSPLILSTLG